jgi:hypothetical protein
MPAPHLPEFRSCWRGKTAPFVQIALHLGDQRVVPAKPDGPRRHRGGQ